jgi:hypothetical protein
VREIRTHGSLSGEWKRRHGRILWHWQPKGPVTCMADLNTPRHSSTLLVSSATAGSIATGALDNDDQVFEVMASNGLAENSDGFVEGSPIVFDDRGSDEDAAVEVGRHPLGASLGAVNGDDTEVLRTNFLNPWREDTGWFAKLAEFAGTTGGAAAFACTHGWIIQDGVDD